MKITVFGTSGKTGRLLIEEALASGHEVVAYARTKESINTVHPKLKVVVGQLSNKEKLKSAISGSDACISTLGGSSMTKHSTEIMEGIANIIAIMEELNVKRFIYMSSIGAGKSRNFMPQPVRFFIADLMLRVPLADHTANENRIMNSKLEWTIIRPGGLTDGAKSDTLKHGSEFTKLTGNLRISRSGVAAFILSQLTDTNYLNKSVWLYE